MVHVPSFYANDNGWGHRWPAEAKVWNLNEMLNDVNVDERVQMWNAGRDSFCFSISCSDSRWLFEGGPVGGGWVESGFMLIGDRVETRVCLTIHSFSDAPASWACDHAAGNFGWVSLVSARQLFLYVARNVRNGGGQFRLPRFNFAILKQLSSRFTLTSKFWNWIPTIKIANQWNCPRCRRRLSREKKLEMIRRLFTTKTSLPSSTVYSPLGFQWNPSWHFILKQMKSANSDDPDASLHFSLETSHRLLTASTWYSSAARNSITSAFFHSGAGPELSGPSAPLFKSAVFQHSMISCTFHVRAM